MHRAQPVGLAIVGSDFRQKFIVRHASRRRQMQFLADSPLYFNCDVDSQRDVLLVVCHVEKSLVERQGFDQVRIVAEYFVDLRRNFLVDLHPAFHENQIRTQSFRPHRRHGRTHAVAPSLVARSRHDAPHLFMPHCDRLAAQFRVVALLYGSIKRVHVHMYDFSIFRHIAKLRFLNRKNRILPEPPATKKRREFAICWRSTKRQCVIIANCCVIIGFRAKSIMKGSPYCTCSQILVFTC